VSKKRPLTELYAPLAIVSVLPIKKQEGNLNFYGLSQDGGRTDFSENLYASLFNDEQSNEPTFSQIHLAGYYL
jgi:hypothetical protein